MARAYFLSFTIVVGAALVAVDYVNKAHSEGVSPGEYSFTRYIDTLRHKRASKPVAQDMSEIVAEEVEARALSSYLPIAPEGWVRREWHTSDRATLEDRGAKPERSEGLVVGDTGRSAGGLIAFLSARPLNASPHEAVWVYEDKRNIVAIEAEYKPRRSGPRSLQDSVAEYVAADIAVQSERKGYARIQGVAFYEIERDAFGSQVRRVSKHGFDIRHTPRRFHAEINNGELKFTVRAKAADFAVRGILQGIDFAGLYALMDVQAPGIGMSDATSPLVSQRQAERDSLTVAATLRNRSEETRQEMEDRVITISMNPVEAVREEGLQGQRASFWTSLKGWIFSSGAQEEVASVEKVAPRRLELHGSGANCKAGLAAGFCASR